MRFTVICSILPTVLAFQFISPDPSEKLDLTGPIEITWTLESSFDEPLARAVSLWFVAFSGDGSSRAGREISGNLSLSAASYTWDPSSAVAAWENQKNTISADKVHHFEARLLNAEGIRLPTIESGQYAVEGYDFISSTGARAGVEGLMVGLAVMGGLLL